MVERKKAGKKKKRIRNQQFIFAKSSAGVGEESNT